MSAADQAPACPDAATLRALLDGTLPDDQQVATQAHVDQCQACETALRQMTAGGESWIGMAEKLKCGSEDDPKLAAALERLKAEDGSGGDSSESTTDPQRTLDFLQPSDDPKLLGKLGQHEISEVVGWGGMGVVLKAYDPSLHRVVAVKVLASHLAHHAVARKRFIREAQAAAAVCHDNVVTIHAIEDGMSGTALAAGGSDRLPPGSPAASAVPLTKGALPKIIMQFVAGGSLQERIDQEAPLELKEILRIAMQTAAGLAAAHAQGVVHRDVKPANILLENGVQRVKLTDFGLARVMDDASLTLSGVIAGTPQYMAPEQAWGRDVDARADLFSLGAVMYAMCSGHSPFRARTTMAVLKRVCEDAPRPLRAINPDVPDWLVAIIEKLLAKNPDERFQSATEVSDLLGHWLAHVQQPTVVPAPPRINCPSFRMPFQSQIAADTSTVSGSVGPGAIPSLSNAERVFMALAMVGACVPFAGLVMFHFAKLPPPAPPLDPGLRYLILSMFWGQFLTLVATTAINFRRKSLEVIPTVIQCVALCLTIYFIPVAIMGFRLLRKRMKSDSPVDESSARRGSPDPAASPDRRSPEFLRGANNEGDLRSSLGAGSGDPRTARGALGLKLALSPLLVMVAVLSVLLILIVGETGTRNLTWYLGFCAFQLAMTLALCSAFYTAWNTSSWIVRIGAMLFFPASGSAFLWAAAYQHAPLATSLSCGLQSVLAFSFLFAVMFIRPLFVRGSGKWMSDRLSGWQQLFAIGCFTIVGTPLVFLLMYWLSSTQRSAVELSQMQRLLAEERSNRAMSPTDKPSKDATKTTPNLPAELKGRWVVVSSKGDTLGGTAVMGMGNSLQVVTPGAFPAMIEGGASAGGMAGAAMNQSKPAPLQWIEFTNDRVIVFDGREATFDADFPETPEPKQLRLRTHGDASAPVAVEYLWRYGIYRLEPDRLIVCWTNYGQPMPSDFEWAWQPRTQLLVLRREWREPEDIDVVGDQPPPPRAVIPFTTDEAQRLQKAWARSAKVPVETTNSLGMTLRLIPAGLNQSGFGMLDTFYNGAVGASFARPYYFATHEVTVAQFQQFVKATGYTTSAERIILPLGEERWDWRAPGIDQTSGQHPVVRVSWQDAQAFCRWLSDTEQQTYRLPTLAEWVFASAAGAASNVRIKSPTNARLEFFDTTTAVGGDTANPFGLHDLFGNASEWLNHDERRDGNLPKRRVAVGGGFRSSMSGDSDIAWLMPRFEQDFTSFDDTGFRVVRVISLDAMVLAGLWPQVEDLVATSARVKLNDPKPADVNLKPNDSGPARGYDGPVVVVRGLFPVASLPQPVESVDFEIEQAESNLIRDDMSPPLESDWHRIDLAKTLKQLESSEFATDNIPALLINSVFTMPLPARADSPWPKELVTHPLLTLTSPKTKYEVQQQLFRFIDFEVSPGHSYSYRVRLKLTPIGKQEKPTVIFTPWSSNSAWVAVEESHHEKER